MRILYFSDIHGNSLVLDSLEKIIKTESPDSICFLGDLFGYFYDYLPIIEFFEKHAISHILGNHDVFAQEILRGDLSQIAFLTSRYGSGYEKLLSNRDRYLNYLNSLEDKKILEHTGKHICMIHGSPEDPLNGRIYPDTTINREDFASFDYVFSGHTHHAVLRKIANTIYVNVGSIGQPRDSQFGSVVIFDSQMDSVRFIKVQIDYRLLMDEVIKHNDCSLDYAKKMKKYVTL